ncbi:MAG: branched-chain amino acid ABC transporter permease [Nitrospinota bacterium]|nr:MAG: branched-chain amino acid ABC transporter permease [Nitrospinota bacterium]
MSLEILGQVCINGLMIGGIYALVSVGLSLIYGVVGFANFAHGSFLMVGMYLTWGLWRWTHLDPLLLLPLVFFCLFGIGWLFYRQLIDPIIRAPDEVHLFLTLGISLMLDNGFLLAFTADRRFLKTVYADTTLYLGNLTLPLTRVLGFVMALLIAWGLFLFLQRTKVGRAIRAVSQDRSLAESVGVDSKQIFAVSVALGIALAGVAGLLLTPFHPISPEVGLRYLLIAFLCVVVGGMGSLKGSILGALLVGVLYSFGYQFFGGEGGLILAYLALLTILNLRPSGLYGKELL